ncbi:unnamed protein product [Caenorhabditis bovis]|uniref:THAP-type domain-containing protein n=1 Tax=Caenorhabditis bovis TaxID=2654633 RepID=A0A8S1ED61_9PELO|nr:unnamed protein product [Caenorhabditis bovis]
MSKRPRFDGDEPNTARKSLEQKEQCTNDLVEAEPSAPAMIPKTVKSYIQEMQYNEYRLRQAEQEQTVDQPFLGASGPQMRQLNPALTMSEIMNSTKRQRLAQGFIDYTQTRYYDRYKQQEYTKRNDFMKYCHVCRKKVVGKLRVLPGDLRMRKVWILRSNLDEERSAELWLKELACEGSHGGEFCEAHFVPGTSHMKGNQLFPIDRRPPEGQHSVLEDILFDFDTILVQCVFCGREGHLNTMLPFIRNRAKRARWIETLANGDVDFKRRLQATLKGGVTQFLCDWHIGDSSFEINGFGEWRLLKNALPDPHLEESDKRGTRIYLVDKCRDMMFWEGDLWKNADRHSKPLSGSREINEESSELMEERNNAEMLTRFLAENMQTIIDQNYQESNNDGKALEEPQHIVEKEIIIGKCEPGPSSKSDDIVYSDDSDEENELIEKIGEIPYAERLCQVCTRIEPVGNVYPFKSELRTWPFDEYRHRKWLEIMDWPSDFEDSMRTLWQKRKTEGNLSDNYHFCPINICQTHLDYRNLPERMEKWLRTFCVLCVSCMSSENLVVPFPPDYETRRKWVEALFPPEKSHRFQIKKVQWLRQRLLRRKATRYRLCVYHFAHNSFVVRPDGDFVFDNRALPIAMESDEFENVPRGPNSVCKCMLCDDWKKQSDMVLLRCPVMESEKQFLAECLLAAERTTIRKTISAMVKHGKPALICLLHYPDKHVDPYSVVAERRIMYGVTAECVLCSHVDDCTSMVPFPIEEDDKLRTKWINAMCREPWIYRYLTKRLAKEGRHYLCASHFSKHALRFQAGMGLWKKSNSTPLLACTNDEERQMVWDLSKSNHEYHPLVLEAIDSNGIRKIDYDQVVELLGYERILEIEQELRRVTHFGFDHNSHNIDYLIEDEPSAPPRSYAIDYDVEDEDEEEEEVHDDEAEMQGLQIMDLLRSSERREQEALTVFDDDETRPEVPTKVPKIEKDEKNSD